MIKYEFLERRFDQLNEDSWVQAEYMVDVLLNNNTREFKTPDNNVDDICYELWREVDSTYNEDIPF